MTALDIPEFETIEVLLDRGILTVSLDRPEVLNAFTQQMLDEFSQLWEIVRRVDDIRVVVLRGNGDRAFSTGMDRKTGIEALSNPWSRVSPAYQLGPKSNHVYKPVVVAVHGLCAGGAFYWLAEADIIICSSDAEFFDPHTSYGMTSPFVAASLEHLLPYGERIRMALMGLDERVTAQRAERLGLVSEVVDPEDLRARAHVIATAIANKPPGVVQATVKAAWWGAAGGRAASTETNLHYSAIGNADVQREDIGAVRVTPERRR